MKEGRVDRSFLTTTRSILRASGTSSRRHARGTPGIEMDMLLEIVDTHVAHDDDMRRACVKVCLVNAINYLKKSHGGETPAASDADSQATASDADPQTTAASDTASEPTASKPYKSRAKKSSERETSETVATEVARFNLVKTYLMPDGKPGDEHTAGEVLDHFAGCHDELTKIVARFGRDVILKTLTPVDVAAALRDQ
jgi:hypothetical protein